MTSGAPVPDRDRDGCARKGLGGLRAGVAVLAVALAAAAGRASGEGRVVDVTPTEAAAVMRERGGASAPVLLDVRTPGEYAAERIDGSILVDFRSPRFREELAALDRDRAYVVYCRTANRSRHAVDLMGRMGFSTVYHMTGGIVKWKETGFSTVR